MFFKSTKTISMDCYLNTISGMLDKVDQALSYVVVFFLIFVPGLYFITDFYQIEWFIFVFFFSLLLLIKQIDKLLIAYLGYIEPSTIKDHELLRIIDKIIKSYSIKTKLNKEIFNNLSMALYKYCNVEHNHEPNGLELHEYLSFKRYLEDKRYSECLMSMMRVASIGDTKEYTHIIKCMLEDLKNSEFNYYNV